MKSVYSDWYLKLLIKPKRSLKEINDEYINLLSAGLVPDTNTMWMLRKHMAWRRVIVTAAAEGEK